MTLEEKWNKYFHKGTDPFSNKMNTSHACHVALTQYYKSRIRQLYLNNGCHQMKNGDMDLVSYYKERLGRQSYCYNIWRQRRYCWAFETHDGRFRSAICGRNGKGISLETDCSATDEEALEIWREFCLKIYGRTFEDVNVDKWLKNDN